MSDGQSSQEPSSLLHAGCGAGMEFALMCLSPFSPGSPEPIFSVPARRSLDDEQGDLVRKSQHNRLGTGSHWYELVHSGMGRWSQTVGR